jgi:hypothetical protein
LSTEKSGQEIRVQSIANDISDTDLLVYVQNVGEGVVQLDEDGCLYVNGALVPCTITGVTVSDGTATLSSGETATLTYSEGAALPGVKMEVKVSSKSGVFSEKSDYPAGKAQAAPVFDHFEFATIDTPQISDVEFTITIRSIDQYDAPYTSYIGTNTLVYSEGDITPATTGGFISGMWTGNVTVTGSATNATLTTVSINEATWVGISNTFEVDAAVTFVSAGVGGVYIPGGTPPINTIPTYPSGLQEDDLILLQIGIRDATTVPNAPTGFTLLYGPDSAGASTVYGRQWVYYKFSDGTETGSLTISWGSGSPTNVISQMFAFRYVKSTGFTEGNSASTQNNDIVYAKDVTTAGPRRLAVNFVFATDNQDIGAFTGETGGNWIVSGYTMGEGTQTNDDSYIVLQTAQMLTTGAISGGSYTRVGVWTQSGGNSWVVTAFALIPSD